MLLCFAVSPFLQAPHIHFLLLEAADILRLHPLPRVHVVQAPAPFVRMLRIPLGSAARHKPSSGSKAGVSAAVQGSGSAGGGVLRCQRATILVLSSAAMQLLQPAELQAAMSCALAPLALDGECEPCQNMTAPRESLE
jgi:hypothetical protein